MYCLPLFSTVVKQQSPHMKKKSGNFDKFSRKKSNAAIKEQFRQEKKQWKKEREEYFEKKRKEKRVGSLPVRQAGREPGAGSREPGVGSRESGAQKMPLNKFIAHCGICSRRDAAEIIKSGKV